MKKRNILISAILTLGVLTVGVHGVSAAEGDKAPQFEKISVVKTNGKVNVSIKAQDDGEMKEEANLCYVANISGKTVEKEVSLKLVNGKYTAALEMNEKYGDETWKVSFITLEDKENNVAVVYNSNVHVGVGQDLSTGNFSATSKDTDAVIIENLTTQTEFKQGGKAEIKIKATSYKDKEQNVTLIVAFYDKNNKFIKLAKSEMFAITTGNEQYIPLTADIPKDGVVIKMFIWDSLEGMNPLGNSIKYDITK